MIIIADTIGMVVKFLENYTHLDEYILDKRSRKLEQGLSDKRFNISTARVGVNRHTVIIALNNPPKETSGRAIRYVDTLLALA